MANEFATVREALEARVVTETFDLMNLEPGQVVVIRTPASHWWIRPFEDRFVIDEKDSTRVRGLWVATDSQRAHAPNINPHTLLAKRVVVRGECWSVGSRTTDRVISIKVESP